MTKISITAEGFEVDSDLEKYVAKKIPRVERRLSRLHRQHAIIAVHFAQRKQGRQRKQSICSLSVTLSSGKSVQATEATLHMYAAFDIAAAHVEQQLRDAKWHLKALSGSQLKKYIASDWPRP